MKVETLHLPGRKASGFEGRALLPQREARKSSAYRNAELRVNRAGAVFRAGKIALDLFATTLNQDDQQYDSDNAGYYPDDRYIVHVNSPFLIVKELFK
jgi:hypothetical protein